MASEDTRIVRVRINVSGKRLIGYVPLPPGEFSRLSDVLNGSEPYILIRDEEAPSARQSRAILKDAISYVEAVVEPGFHRKSPQVAPRGIPNRDAEPKGTGGDSIRRAVRAAIGNRDGRPERRPSIHQFAECRVPRLGRSLRFSCRRESASPFHRARVMCGAGLQACEGTATAVPHNVGYSKRSDSIGSSCEPFHAG